MTHKFQNDPVALWKHLFEQSVIGIALVGKDGHWLKANPKLQDVLGYSEYELQNINFQTLTMPDDNTSDMEMLKRVEAGEIESYSMRKRYITKDGKMVWIRLTVNPFFGPINEESKNAELMYYISQIEPLGNSEAKLEKLLERQIEMVEKHITENINVLKTMQEDIENQKKSKFTPLAIFDRHAQWIIPTLIMIVGAILVSWRDSTIESQSVRRMEAQIQQILSNQEPTNE